MNSDENNLKPIVLNKAPTIIGKQSTRLFIRKSLKVKQPLLLSTLNPLIQFKILTDIRVLSQQHLIKVAAVIA